MGLGNTQLYLGTFAFLRELLAHFRQRPQSLRETLPIRNRPLLAFLKPFLLQLPHSGGFMKDSSDPFKLMRGDYFQHEIRNLFCQLPSEGGISLVFQFG